MFDQCKTLSTRIVRRTSSLDVWPVQGSIEDVWPVQDSIDVWPVQDSMEDVWPVKDSIEDVWPVKDSIKPHSWQNVITHVSDAAHIEAIHVVPPVDFVIFVLPVLDSSYAKGRFVWKDETIRRLNTDNRRVTTPLKPPVTRKLFRDGKPLEWWDPH